MSIDSFQDSPTTVAENTHDRVRNNSEIKDYISRAFDPTQTTDLRALLNKMREDGFPDLKTSQFVRALYASVVNSSNPVIQSTDGTEFNFEPSKFGTAGFAMIKYLEEPVSIKQPRTIPEQIQIDNAAKVLDKICSGFKGVSIKLCLENFLWYNGTNSLLDKVKNKFTSHNSAQTLIDFVNSDEFFNQLLSRFSPEIGQLVFDGQVGGIKAKTIASALTKSGLSSEDVKQFLRFREIQNYLKNNAQNIVDSFSSSTGKIDILGGLSAFDGGIFNGLDFKRESQFLPIFDLDDSIKQRDGLFKRIRSLREEILQLNHESTINPNNAELLLKISSCEQDLKKTEVGFTDLSNKIKNRRQEVDSYNSANSRSDEDIRFARREYFKQYADGLFFESESSQLENGGPELIPTFDILKEEAIETTLDSDIQSVSQTLDEDTQTVEAENVPSSNENSAEIKTTYAFEISGQSYSLQELIEMVKNSDKVIVSLADTIFKIPTNSRSYNNYKNLLTDIGLDPEDMIGAINTLVNQLSLPNFQEQATKILTQLFLAPKILEFHNRAKQISYNPEKIKLKGRYPGYIADKVKTITFYGSSSPVVLPGNFDNFLINADPLAYINSLENMLVDVEHYITSLSQSSPQLPPESTDTKTGTEDEPQSFTPEQVTQKAFDIAFRNFSESLSTTGELSENAFLAANGRSVENLFGCKIGETCKVDIMNGKYLESQEVVLTQEYILAVTDAVFNHQYNSQNKLKIVYFNNRNNQIITDSDIAKLSLKEFFQSNYSKNPNFTPHLINTDSKHYQDLFGNNTHPTQPPIISGENDGEAVDNQPEEITTKGNWEDELIFKNPSGQWYNGLGELIIFSPNGLMEDQAKKYNEDITEKNQPSQPNKTFSPEAIKNSLSSYLGNIFNQQPSNLINTQRDKSSPQTTFNSNEQAIQRLIRLMNPKDPTYAKSSIFHIYRIDSHEMKHNLAVNDILSKDFNSPIDVFVHSLRYLGNRLGGSTDTRELHNRFTDFVIVANVLEKLPQDLHKKLETFLTSESYSGQDDILRSRYTDKFINSLSLAEIETVSKTTAQLVGL